MIIRGVIIIDRNQSMIWHELIASLRSELTKRLHSHLNVHMRKCPKVIELSLLLCNITCLAWFELHHHYLLIVYIHCTGCYGMGISLSSVSVECTTVGSVAIGDCAYAYLAGWCLCD